ncbi:MAG: spore photoproduct lyase family protein [Candidatus Binatia bacterium]
MNRFAPAEVWIERSELDTAMARAVRDAVAPELVRVFDTEEPPRPAGVRAGKRALVVRRHRGGFLRHCPAGTAGLVCCSYLTVNLASNCPLDCAYCFLQDYLADAPALTAYSNVETALAEVDGVLRAHPDRQFRIGTGEIADSLALDPLTKLSHHLVPFFAARPNGTLELKTKTDCVDELLGLDPGGRVVISWSLNAEAVIASDEPDAATLAERLAAARRVWAGGYRVGLHFDPLIEFDGWEAAYAEAVAAVAQAIPARAIAWVSLGSLRLSAPLAHAMRRREVVPRGLAAELVAGPDGKARVWRGLRLRMYRYLVARIRAALGPVPLYLCMESPAVWQQVMDEVPSDRVLGLRLAAGAAW